MNEYISQRMQKLEMPDLLKDQREDLWTCGEGGHELCWFERRRCRGLQLHSFFLDHVDPYGGPGGHEKLWVE